MMSSGRQRDHDMVCPTDITQGLVAVLHTALLMWNTRSLLKSYRIPWAINIFGFWLYLNWSNTKLWGFVPFNSTLQKTKFYASNHRAS